MEDRSTKREVSPYIFEAKRGDQGDERVVTLMASEASALVTLKDRSTKREVGPYILEAKRGDQGAKQNIMASEARIPEGPLAKEKTWKGANTGTEPVREKYDAKQDARRDGGARTSEVDGTRCTRHGWETNRSNEDTRLRKGETCIEPQLKRKSEQDTQGASHLKSSGRIRNRSRSSPSGGEEERQGKRRRIGAQDQTQRKGPELRTDKQIKKRT